MISPEAAGRETERLARLRSYALFDAPPDAGMDELSALAALVARTPIAMVNLVDEDTVWVRAHTGVELCRAPREAMMCTHVVAEERALVVPDLSLDERFAYGPFVATPPFVRFYAGVPLRDDDGFVLGTVCVLDYQPRTIEPAQLRSLETIARQVMSLMHLRRTTVTLGTVIAQATDGIIIVDERKRLSLNPTARALFGIEEPAPTLDALPLGSLEDGSPVAATDAPLARALRGEEVLDQRFHLGERVLDASATPLRRPDGSRSGAVLIVRDQTARAHLERALEQSRDQAREALHARDEFLSIAAHELRTPVTALQLQAQTIRRHSLEGLPPSLAPRIELMLQQSERLSTLIRQLLDVTRIARDSLELEVAPVELRGLLEEIVARYAADARRAGCALVLHAPTEVHGQWDRGRLEQVITNLLSNAMKYGRGKPIDVALAREAGEAVLSVHDEGIGISPEDQARIFNRFERAAPGRTFQGLGLGLFITRQIVEASGGSIGVTSEPGKGATFTVRLPVGRNP